jgi:hypothetical protein
MSSDSVKEEKVTVPAKTFKGPVFEHENRVLQSVDTVGLPTPPLQFRLVLADDLGFVLNSWLKSFRMSSWPSVASDAVYFPNQQRLIGEIAARENARLVVACNPDNPGQIYGWACGERATDTSPLIMHYVYVKETFRKMSIGTQLLGQFGWENDNQVVLATHDHYHLFEANKSLSKKFRISCNPYILLLKGGINVDEG